MNDEQKLMVERLRAMELGTCLEAAGMIERLAAGASEGDVLKSLLADITAIDTWYRGSPSYEHDAGWFKDRVVRLLEERIAKENGDE